MTGERVATSPSEDELFEVYATHSGTVGPVRIFAAVRPVAGRSTYDLTVTGLADLGFRGTHINIRTLRFDGPDLSTEIGDPVDLGVVQHEVTDDQVTCWVLPEEVTTAYAFEFVQ